MILTQRLRKDGADRSFCCHIRAKKDDAEDGDEDEVEYDDEDEDEVRLAFPLQYTSASR